MIILKRYLLNCFVLLIPVILWNIFLFDSLPKPYSSSFFEQDIPKYISYSERTIRTILFGATLLMVLQIKTKTQKIGLIFYLVGIIMYFLSWLALIFVPENAWGLSKLGFMAPAYTPLIWLIGVGLIGGQSRIKIPYLSQVYILLSVLFVLVHTLHSCIVFQRL